MPEQMIGPASTPQLYFENQFKLSQQQTLRRYQNLQKQFQTQQIDYESAVKEIADMQAEADAQTEAFQSGMQMMQQSQKFVDLGLITPEQHQEAMWAQVLPRELQEALYPKPEQGPTRAPFSPTQMEGPGKGTIGYTETIEPFLRTAPIKRKGAFGIDWLKKDIAPSLSRILKAYDAWRTSIGYGSMTFDQQGQVDYEWDLYVEEKGWKNWSPKLEAVKTRRARGPLTRGYGSRFRGTPTGPREATNPLQVSVATALPKQKEPKPKPEPQPRMWARNPKTKKRLFSDDGGQTWQSAK